MGEVLCDQVMRPLRKDNGKARNISLTETLMGLASATTQEAVRSIDDKEGLAWNQYSAHPPGPELLLMTMQGLLTVRVDSSYLLHCEQHKAKLS